MVSQTSLVSSEASFKKRKKRKGRCSCSNTFFSYTKRMIPFVRDFPKGCGPRGRFATRCSQHLVQSETSSFSSESEDLVVPLLDNALESVSSKEVERKDVPQTLDKTDPIDLLETSDHEAKELPEKVVSGFMSKGYTPHERVLAIRDYPSPPGRFQTPFSEDLVQSKVPDSSPCYDSEFEDLMVSFPENNGLESIKSAEEETAKTLDNNELIGLEETSEYEAKELSEESEDSIISMYKISLNSYGLSEEEEEEEEEEEAKELPEESEDSIISMYNISLNSCGLSEEEEEGINRPKVIDSMGLIDQSETSEPKATDLTEETSSNSMSPILPPNTIDSTITDFPKGCRRRGPQIREEDILESTTNETKGLNHKLSHAEDPLLEVLSDSEESCSPNSCKSKLKESEKLSSQCSNQFLEKGPSTTKNQVPKGPKQIVIALMAAPNCPGSQKKRASRSNTTRDTNKRKRKKRLFPKLSKFDVAEDSQVIIDDNFHLGLNV